MSNRPLSERVREMPSAHRGELSAWAEEIAALEAKCERLERERDDLREIGSRLVAAIDGALDDSAVAPLSVLMMVRAEMDAALEGRGP